jgi:hypothetical protein
MTSKPIIFIHNKKRNELEQAAKVEGLTVSQLMRKITDEYLSINHPHLLKKNSLSSLAGILSDQNNDLEDILNSIDRSNDTPKDLWKNI